MVITLSKGQSGSYFFFFFCVARQKRLWDLPFLGMAGVEEAVEQHLATIRSQTPFGSA